MVATWTGRLAWAFCPGLIALHALLVFLAFPGDALLSEAPLHYIDSPFHQYQMWLARELWADRGLIGYDPWFAAGHLGGVNYNASAKLPALMATALGSGFDPAWVYKWYVFLAAVVAPPMVWIAARLLRCDPLTVATATLLGVLAWWISALRWYHTAGMVAFVLAAYAALPYVALAWRAATERPRVMRLLVLACLGALGIFLHPLFPLPILFALPCIALVQRQDVKLASLLLMTLVLPLAALLPNLLWALPSLNYPGWSDGHLSPYQKVVDLSMLGTEALGRIAGYARGAKINPVLLLCTAWAVAAAGDVRRRALAAGFALAALALATFAAVGASWSVFATLQPNRLSSAAYLLLVIPAAMGVRAVVDYLGSAVVRLRWGARATAALLLVAAALLGSELRNELSASPTPHNGRPAPEVRGVGELTQQLVDWIARNTSDEARVLFETSAGRIHDQAHVAGYLALATRREFIGGPYVFMHHAGFWDGHAFGQPIIQFSAEEFTARLEHYNVGWIVTHNAASADYLGRLSGLALAARMGPLTIYRVRSPAGFFLRGSGRVVARGVGHIEVDDAAGDSVVLKYHYFEGMVSDPPAVLRGFKVDGDPVPMIEVVSPPRRFSLGWRPSQ